MFGAIQDFEPVVEALIKVRVDLNRPKAVSLTP